MDMDKKMDERTVDLLYRSFDAPLEAAEEERLAAALAGSPELRRLKDEIIAMRRAVAEGAVRSFRPGFADRTLARLRTGPAREDRLAALVRAYAAAFRPVAVVGLAVLAVLVLYSLANRELLPRDAIFYASDLAVDKLLHLPVF
jgi:anti-sigma factor RsiW